MAKPQSDISRTPNFHMVRLRAGAARFLRSGPASIAAPAITWPEDVLPGAVIGNFDGMHLGHASLADLLKSGLNSRAAELGRRPVGIFMSFVPHPRRVLTGVSRSAARAAAAGGDTKWSELTPFREKCRIAQRHGLDYGCFLTFGAPLQSLSAEQFVSELLVKTLGLKMVVVGYDWKFGKNRQGDVDSLRELGGRFGVEVIVAPKLELSGEDGTPLRVSSSLVKAALSAGDLDETKRLIGRPFSISGRVRHGDHRGKTIGFPTANLHLPLQLLPPDGVYAAWSIGPDQAVSPAALNIGTRPTFNGAGRRVEVHLLDPPAGELYGRRLIIEFAAKIRGEQRFESVEALKSQIESDVQTARKILQAAAAPAVVTPCSS